MSAGTNENLAKTIDAAFEQRDTIGPSTKGAVREAVEQALDLLDRGEARVAEKAADGVLARQSVAEEGGAAVVPAQRHERNPRRSRPRRVVGQGAVEVRQLARQEFPRRRLPRGAGLRGAPLRLYRARRGADAVVRQSRRLCGFRHHDRHLVDGRLLRADRQELSHLRRRRHRRRARAAAGRAGDRRGQLLHRRALGSRRRRHRARRRGAVHGRVHRRLDQDRRPRQRRGVSGRGAGLFGGGAGHALPASRARTAKPARAFTAPSSSSASTRRPAPRPRSTNCCAIDAARLDEASP